MTRRIALALIAAALAIAPARAQPPDGLLVFAAASLTDAMNDVARLWHDAGHPPIRFSFAASSTLARQLDQGARAHILASADEQWMDWAQQRGLIAPDTRRTLLGNRLVLAAPADRVPDIAIAPGMDLLALLGPNGRLAIADPAGVPAGRYAREALTRLGIWAAIEPRLARADNVRAALLLVERGEAPLGIVYATDVAAARRTRIAATFPADLTTPITYPFAVTRAGDTPLARRFLAFLSTPPARDAFTRRGFVVE